VEDNWAMIYAQQLATSQTTSANKVFPLAVVFNLVPSFLNATRRQYAFMLKGLQIVEQQLKDLNIPFFLLQVRNSVCVLKFNELIFVLFSSATNTSPLLNVNVITVITFMQTGAYIIQKLLIHHLSFSYDSLFY
jgi:deoxyribodipyrimidine photolyase